VQSLEKRIAALEISSKPTDNMTIIRRLVRPGHVHAEVQRISDDEGLLWERMPGETEQALIDRATLATKPNAWGVRSLTADTDEVPHGEH